MENVIKILPIIVVVLVVFLVREGFSIYKYLKNCQLHEAAKTDKILAPVGRAPGVKIDHAFAILTQPSTQGITPLDWTSEYLDPKQRNALLRFAHEKFSVLPDDTIRHET